MIKFSNMTLQEFINLNRDEIPEEVLEYFDELQAELRYWKGLEDYREDVDKY